MTYTTKHRRLISGVRQRAASLMLPLAAMLVIGIVSTRLADGQTYKETVMHRFTGFGNDGMNPIGPTATLLRDKTGTLYGATNSGGAWGQGTLFKLDEARKETILHTFTGNADGGHPNGSLVADASGNLYGTAASGGNLTCNQGCGVVFMLQPSTRKYTILHAFAGNDGASPAGLIRDSEGNLYGITFSGGAYGDGVLFKLDTAGHLIVLYSFSGNSIEGAGLSGPTRDSQGNFYIASEVGGPSQYQYNCIQRNYFPVFGCGTIFKIDRSRNETLLHAFSGIHGDGGSPVGAVVIDSTGNIYGATLLGGTGLCQPEDSSTPGCGTVFKIDSTGKYSVIFSFPEEGQKGAGALGGLATDAAGNLYGATEDGGLNEVCDAQWPNVGGGFWTAGAGCGVVFKLDVKTKLETVLHKFTGKGDGGNPESGLILDSMGNLYGTTYTGGDDNTCGNGYGCGTVFKLVPGQQH